MSKQKRKITKIFSALSAGFFLSLAGIQAVLAQWDKAKLDATKLPKAPIYGIVVNIAQWLLAIFGFVAIIGFVVSALIYFISAGDEDLQERAKRAMIYSITGVIVGLVGLVVIYAVDYLLMASPII